MKENGKEVSEKAGALKFGPTVQNTKVRNILPGFSLRFIGEWRNNKANGKGKFWHVDGDIFEGKKKSKGKKN